MLDDLKLHKLRMKTLAEEVSVAEAWEIELEARRQGSLLIPKMEFFIKLIFEV